MGKPAVSIVMTEVDRDASQGIEGFYDESSPGVPQRIGDVEVAETVRLTLETLPQGATASPAIQISLPTL